MAESMVGLKRSHRCTEVSSADIGKKVTVMGWVAKRRNLGALIFVDLRDRSGILQILFDENIIGKEGFDKAYTCLLYTSPSPRDISGSRMPSSA